MHKNTKDFEYKIIKKINGTKFEKNDKQLKEKRTPVCKPRIGVLRMDELAACNVVVTLLIRMFVLFL